MKMSDKDKIVAVCCLWSHAGLLICKETLYDTQLGLLQVAGKMMSSWNWNVAALWKKSVYRLITGSFSKIEMHYLNLSAKVEIFYFENLWILWTTVKSTMHHLISKIYEIFQGFFHLASRKTSKLQISWQNEKLNYLVALQLRVGGVKNYCPSNTGQDWWN